MPSAQGSLDEEGSSSPSRRTLGSKRFRGSATAPAPAPAATASSGSERWGGVPVAIIGGGIAGLACGLALQRRGVRASVFDTGKRGPGGRASSRILQHRGETFVVDHAAQAITAKAPEVLDLFGEMERKGVVNRWRGVVGTLAADGTFKRRDDSKEGPLWIGNDEQGIGAVAEWLAKEQRVYRDVWVARLGWSDGDLWRLSDQRGRQVGEPDYSYVVMAHNGKCADRLIKTAPERTVAHDPLRCRFVPQASKTTDRLELNSLWMCIVTAPPGVANFDGAWVEGHSVLSWMGNNASKYPGAASREAWTLISTAAYGTANKCPQEFIPPKVRDQVSREMCEAFSELVGVKVPAGNVLHLQLWGAAVPVNRCEQHFIHDATARIGICGDWLTTPSIEGAMFSGFALAAAIHKDLCDGGLASTKVRPFTAVAGGHAMGSFDDSCSKLLADQVVEAAVGSSRSSGARSPGASGGGATAPAAATESDTVWNFAFGANINPRKLRDRRGINPIEEVRGHLEGWRLVFNHSGGMGNIQPISELGSEAEAAEQLSGPCPTAVHGMLLRLHPKDFQKLCNMEHEYITEEVEVVTYDGRRILAQAFVSPPEYRLPHYLPPPERYLNLIRQGARTSQLEGSYQAWLMRLRSVKDRGPEYYDHEASSRRQQEARRQAAWQEQRQEQPQRTWRQQRWRERQAQR